MARGMREDLIGIDGMNPTGGILLAFQVEMVAFPSHKSQPPRDSGILPDSGLPQPHDMTLALIFSASRFRIISRRSQHAPSISHCSAGFSFFTAGVNDDSLVSIVSYIRTAYQIGMNVVVFQLYTPLEPSCR